MTIVHRGLLALALMCAGLVVAPTAAQAFPALQPPFQVGVTWYVCQGYNGGPSHSGDPALDMTTDPNRGPNGCYGDANHATGKPVFAPAGGQLANLNNGYGGVCITFPDNTSMYLGHLSNRRASGPVALGEQIGTVAAAGAEANGGYAHVHLSARSGPSCGGTKLPFSGSARFAGAPDMTNNGTANQWAGTSMVRTGAGPIRGSFDSASSPAPGQLQVRGWAFDEDARTTPVSIHMYVGGPAGAAGVQGFDLGAANTHRADVGAAYPGVGDHHGFDRTVDVSRFGNVPVYVYAINVPGTPGDHVLLGTRTVHIPQPDPFGSLDGLGSPKAGFVRVSGWAADPSAPTTSLAVHVYSGTRFLGSIPANMSRPDVGAAFPGYGNMHGYDATLQAPPGALRVCTYGINVGVGSNSELGCRTVDVAADVAAPETTIVSGPPATGPASTVTVAFASNEDPVTFACQWDGGAWSPCVSPVTKNVTQGAHTFAVRATDAAGNTDASPAQTSFTVAPPVAGPPPVAAPARVLGTVKAVQHRSRIRVDLGPDSADRAYKFSVQRLRGGAWRTVLRSRTQGRKDLRLVEAPRGRYRVVVPTQHGMLGFSTKVRLRR